MKYKVKVIYPKSFVGQSLMKKIGKEDILPKFSIDLEMNYGDKKEVCEAVFAEMQHDHPNGSYVEKNDIRCRSMSIGDLVSLKHEDESIYAIVDTIGFKFLTEKQFNIIADSQIAWGDRLMGLDWCLKNSILNI